MALPSSSNDPLKYLNGLRKPESMQQSQYRGVNSNSTGGARGTPALRRSDVPSWSLNGGISPATASAGQSFNRAAQSPSDSTGKIIGDRITENMQNASAQGRQDANTTVDNALNAKMGFYATPQNRQAGFFQRGMGPMAGDAVIMQRQNRPLGDGGPAASAARSDQENRRRQAEAAMDEVGPDGLTRYMPNQDLLGFANQERMKEDQRISMLTGGGTNYRQPMQAMTPSDIQFWRHKMSMLTNSAYADRVNSQRADRQEMLDNRREMVRARRAGALEAAGASQQLRNLQAGRGALAGQDGFGALMGAAAQQNPNQAFDSFGQAAMANNAPGMLRDRLRAEENMLGTRANLDRMQQYETMRMQIIGSGMPEIEKQRALNSLNTHIMSGGGYGTFDLAQVGRDAASGSGGVGIPSWVPLPVVRDGDARPTIERVAEYRRGLTSNPQWMQLPQDQRDAILSQIESQYFGGVSRSDKEQYMQDRETNPFKGLWNWGAGMFGMDGASATRRQEERDAISPYQSGVEPYRPGQHQLTPEETGTVEQYPDSRDRVMMERFFRNRGYGAVPPHSMNDARKVGVR